jgi:hypothetical protein
LVCGNRVVVIEAPEYFYRNGSKKIKPCCSTFHIISRLVRGRRERKEAE